MYVNVSTDGTDERLIDVVTVNFFVVLTVYDYLMLFMGIAGNGMILYGTFLYNAIDLDKVSLVLVKNITVADLLWSIVTTLTICVSNSAINKWVLGEVMCVLVSYLRHPLAATEIMLVCVVTVHRVISLRCALKGDPVSTGAARIIAGTLWTVSFISIIGVALFLRVPVSYDRLYSTCVMIWTEGETVKLAAVVLTVLLIIIPFMITIICNLGLLGYVLKLQQTGEKRPTTAFVTVFSICGLFTITNLPNMARILLPTFKVDPPEWLGIVNAHVYIINASCNAVILTVTNRRFRRFLMRRLCFRSISSPLSLLSSGGMNNNNHIGPRSHVTKNNDYELRQL